MRIRNIGVAACCGLVAALVLSLSSSPARANTIPVTAGATTIQLPLDAGYASASRDAPAIMAAKASQLPADSHLLEIFMTKADIDRAAHHGSARDVCIVVASMQAFERVRMSLAEWNKLKPELVSYVTGAEAKGIAEAAGRRVGALESERSGKKVDVSRSLTQSLKDYRETPVSVALSTVLASRTEIDGATESSKWASVLAYVLVRNKLIVITAYYPITSGSPEKALATVRARVDAFVDELVALNPTDPALPSSRE